MKLLAATNNAHKLVELRAILAPHGVEVLSGADVGGIPDVDETGTTFEANARLKAVEVARATGLPVFADDSGLEVIALDCEPGVYSARYAPDNASKMAKVLAGLNGKPDRGARFVCVIALADADGVVGTARGEVSGVIADAPRGDHGFGYDPIFIPDGYTETFGELSSAIKDQLSHRARALQAALAAGLFDEVRRRQG